MNQNKYPENDLMIILDTTGSMSSSLTAVIESITLMSNIISLFNINLTILCYGDYDKTKQTIDSVTQVYQSSSPNFLKLLTTYSLCSNGGGGDTIEALRTALYKANNLITTKTGIIIISDACGRTSCIECSNCPEQENLENNAIKNQLLTIEMLMTFLLSKGCILSEINSNTHTIFSNGLYINKTDFYKQNGGLFCHNRSLTKENVFHDIFKIFTNYFGLTKKNEQYTTILQPITKKLSSRELTDFRTLICTHPEILQHIPNLATTYYQSLSNDDNPNNHAEFFKKISLLNISPEVRNMFKDAQFQLTESLDTLQNKDTLGKRIYSPVRENNATLTELLQLTLKTSKLQQLFRSFVLIDTTSEYYKDSIPLSEIIKNPSLLVSYVGRDQYNNYQKYTKVPVIYACILTMTHETLRAESNLRTIICDLIKKDDFLDFKKNTSLSPFMFNADYFSLLFNAFRGLIDTKKEKVMLNIWKLIKLQTLYKQDITLEVLRNPSHMTSDKIIEYTTGINLTFDFALGIPFVSTIFYKFDSAMVSNVIKNLRKYQIQTENHYKNLSLLVKEYTFIYLSAYTGNFYLQYINGCCTQNLDKYMTFNVLKTQTLLHEKYELFKQQYLQEIGRNGENIFNHLVLKTQVNGPKIQLCSKCKIIYARQDTECGVTASLCVQCRTTYRITGDRAPSDNIKLNIVQCKNNHQFVNSLQQNIELDCSHCPLCNLSITELKEDRYVSFSSELTKNTKYFSTMLQIPSFIITDVCNVNGSVCNYVNTGNSLHSNIFLQWEDLKSEHTTIYIDGSTLSEKSNDRLVELLEHNLYTTCLCCCNDVHFTQLQQICTNTKCSGYICINCIQTMYTVNTTHTGLLQKKYYSCYYCQQLIKSIIGSRKLPHIKYIKKMVNKNPASIIFKCSSIRCDEKCNDSCVQHCKNKKTGGFFITEKSECAVDMSTLQKLCPCCIKYESTYRSDYLKLGFVFYNNIMMRKCPCCNELYERIDGCAHLTCLNKSCRMDFCYCCGQGFKTSNDVYKHLISVYNTYYPTLLQIKKHFLS